MILDSVRSMITDIGLNKIFEAKTVNDGQGWSGVYIDIAYWVPVLDPSNNMDTNETIPVGNVHWNNGNHTFTSYKSLYSGVVYTSILGDEVTSGHNNVEVKSRRSNFKIICENFEDQDIEFNKIALYAVVRGEPGNIHGSPFFFGQVLVKDQAPYYELYGTSSSSHNQFIVNYQLAFNETNQFSNVFYSNSADSWEKTTNHYDEDTGTNQYGITWDGSVVIGVPDVDVNWWEDATGDIKDAKYTITSYNNELNGQVGLQYIDDTTETVNDGDTLPHRRRAIFNVDECSDLELDIYGGCNGDSYYNVFPKNDNMYFLGNAPNLTFVDNDLSNSSNKQSNSSLYSVGTRRWSSLYLYRQLEITNNDFDILFNPVSNNVLGVGSAKYDNTSIRVGHHYRYNDSCTNEYYYTHSNISNDMCVTTSSFYEYDLGIRSTMGVYISNIDMSRIPSLETGVGDNLSENPSDVINSKIDKLIEYNDIRKIVNNEDNIFHLLYPTTLDDKYIKDIWDNNDVEDFRFFLKTRTTETDINLVSSKYIWHTGDMVPMVDSLHDIGSAHHGIHSLFIDTIGGEQVGITGNLYSDIKGNIGRHPVSGHRWNIISSNHIGDPNGVDNIYSGVFKNLRVDPSDSITTELIHVSSDDLSSTYNNDDTYSVSDFGDGLSIGKYDYKTFTPITLAGTTNYACITPNGFGILGKDLVLGSCANKITEGHFKYIVADNIYLKETYADKYYLDFDVSQDGFNAGFTYMEFKGYYTIQFEFTLNVVGLLDSVSYRIKSIRLDPTESIGNGSGHGDDDCDVHGISFTKDIISDQWLWISSDGTELYSGLISDVFEYVHGIHIPTFPINVQPLELSKSFNESKKIDEYDNVNASADGFAYFTYTNKALIDSYNNYKSGNFIYADLKVCEYNIGSKNYPYFDGATGWAKCYDRNK